MAQGLDKELILSLPDRFSHAVIAWVTDDGYPVSVATGFHTDGELGMLWLDQVAAPTSPPLSQPVEVVFSHIRPQPGIGYDERRYVSIKGRLEQSESGLLVRGEGVTGWDEAKIPFFEYAERGVPRAVDYLARLSAARGIEVRPRLSPGWLFLRATRLPFLSATIIPVLLGIAVAARDRHLDVGLAVLTLIAAICVHLGLNVSNDIFDTLSGADAASLTPTQFSGGSRVIIYQLVRMRTMALMALAFYAAGAGIGLLLAINRGLIPLLGLGLIGLLLSVAYTAPPFRLVHRGLGELSVGLGFGPIMVLGAYFVQAQRFSVEALYVSLPVGILVALILYLNEIPDRTGDALANKRTLPVRLDKQTVVASYRWAVAATAALVVTGAVVGVLPRLTLISLAAVPLAIGVMNGLQASYDSAYELMPVLGRNIRLHAAFGLLLVLGYVAVALGTSWLPHPPALFG